MSDAKSLELIRNDLLQTAATRRATLVVFPSGAHKQQKIGTGDLSGVVQCFSVKGQEVKTSFKSLPSRQCITSVTLGRGASQRDRMFFAENGVVRGLTKKGKEFFRFDTNMTESVSGLAIQDSILAILGEYACVVFEDNREKSFFMSPDRLNAFDGFVWESKFCLALACQDRRIRIIKANTVLHQVSVQGVATCVVHTPESHDPSCQHPEAQEILYGTENGILGQLFLDHDGLHSGFVMENPDGHGAITALYAGIDFTMDGMNDIAVGRDDGRIEIYSMDEKGQLCKLFETQLPDRINTLAGGFITSSSAQDLVVQTYAGKVIAYTKEGCGLFADPTRSKRALQESQQEQVERLGFLEAKIEEMKHQVGALAQQIKQKKHDLRCVALPDVPFVLSGINSIFFRVSLWMRR